MDVAGVISKFRLFSYWDNIWFQNVELNRTVTSLNDKAKGLSSILNNICLNNESLCG